MREMAAAASEKDDQVVLMEAEQWAFFNRVESYSVHGFLQSTTGQ